mgnify:CR=1 FL=1
MKRKWIAFVACAALVGTMALAAGCSNDPVEGQGVSGQSNAAVLSGTLNLNGSTSMAEISNALGERFMEKNQGVTVTVGGNGSGEGPTSVSAGTAQIGLLSRDVKSSENPDDFDIYTIAFDGIAMAVNPKNTVTGLTQEQIGKIYTGEITNWKDVGGNDAEIVLIGREAGSGTRDGFESITGTEDACKYQNEYTSTGEVVAGVASNPNAIGYASLSAVTGDDTVKILTVGGVAPSEDTVLDGSYAIQRNFNFIISDSTPLSDAAQAFVDWATSTEASDLIAGAGAVPVAE